MITWEFSLESQRRRYDEVRGKLKTGFYQNLKFYVLPFIPPKFRNRVVFLPEVCEPEKLYKKHKIQLENLEKEWNKTKSKYLPKISAEFPKMDSLEISISPSLYGTVGGYHLAKGKIILEPRFDRKINDVYQLLINSLNHYFNFGWKKELDNTPKWQVKQKVSQEIFEKIFGKEKTKSKGMLKILDREFAGKLAQESLEYLNRLGFSQDSSNLPNPTNLTKNEILVFELLKGNRNKLVSFDQIGDALWKDNPDKYSEYAITKLVERLKKKLSKNSIHSQRGVGYILV